MNTNVTEFRFVLKMCLCLCALDESSPGIERVNHLNNTLGLSSGNPYSNVQVIAAYLTPWIFRFNECTGRTLSSSSSRLAVCQQLVQFFAEVI